MVKSSAELIAEHNKPIPFINENGDVPTRITNKGGIQMLWCYNCKGQATGSIANICSLCGKEVKLNLITVKEFQQRSIKLKKKGYTLIGHEDPKWWDD